MPYSLRHKYHAAPRPAVKLSIKGKSAATAESASLFHLEGLRKRHLQPAIMAVARPIRVLALVTAGLWVFFIYQIFGPTKYPLGPGDTLKHIERDPNLDRRFPMQSLVDVC